MNVRDYQRFLQKADIPNGAALTIEGVYDSGEVLQTPDGGGNYTWVGNMVIKINDILPDSNNAPTIVSVTPTWNGGAGAAPAIVTVDTWAKNSIFMVAHSNTGSFTYDIAVSWVDNNGALREGTLEFKIIVS